MAINKRINLTVDAGNAQASIDKLKKEFNGLDSSTKKTKKTLLDYNGSLSKAERITMQSLGTTSKSERAKLKYDTTLRKLNQALDKGTISQNQHSAALRSAETRFDEVSQNAKKMGNRLVNVRDVVRTLAASFAAIGIGVGLRDSIQQVAQFETSLNKLRAISGATEAQMKSLEDQSRSLGATTIFSAQQTADAQAFLAQAGFDVNEVIESTPGILSLATAGGIDLARAADIASNALGGMQMEVSELNKLNDVMAATASRSNTNIEQMGEALSYAAPVAQSAGVRIEELSAAIGVLGDSGIQSSRAGRAMVGMIRQLSNATPEATKRLASYGLTLDQLDVKTNGLTNVLQTLRDANIDTADAFKIFGSEVAPAFNILASGSDRMSELTSELQDSEGAADKMAKTMSAGLANSFRTLNSAVGETILSLNDSSGLGASLQSLITNTAGLLSVWNGLGQEFAESNDYTIDQLNSLQSVADILKTTATFVASTAVAYGTLTTAITLYTARAALATKAQLLLNAAMRANPVGLLATAIGGAATLAFIQFRRQAQETADQLESVRNQAEELYGTIGKLTDAQKQNRIESLKGQIRAAEAASDVNSLLDQRRVMFEQMSIAEQQGNEQSVAGFQRSIDAINEQISATGEQSDNVEKLRRKLAELTGEQDKNSESKDKNTDSTEENSEKVQKIIDRLVEEARTLNMTSGELAAYNVLMAGGTAEQAKFAQSLVTTTNKIKDQSESVKQAESDYQNWLTATRDSLDPMRELQREASKVMDALSRGDLSAEDARAYMQELTGGVPAVHKVKQALDDYVESAYDFETAFADVVSNTLSGLENQLTDFVMTGKLNFKDLANAIIADLVRIQIRAAVTAPLANAFSSAFGGSGTTADTPSAKGNAFVGGEVQRFAKGGLPSLSGYSNSVVNTPTRFAMGAGLMGEAGPEAILPLKRTSSGDLGVASSGGSGQELNVNVNLTNTSGEPMQMKETGRRRDGDTLDIDLVIANKVNQAIGSGRADQGMRSRFGVTPVGG